MCCCKSAEWVGDGLLSARLHLVLCRQVPEAVEELRQTTPSAGQQPQGQADWQAEADTERGGLKANKRALIFLVAFDTLVF